MPSAVTEPSAHNHCRQSDRVVLPWQDEQYMTKQHTTDHTAEGNKSKNATFKTQVPLTKLHHGNELSAESVAPTGFTKLYSEFLLIV